MQDASPAVFGGAFGVTGMATHLLSPQSPGIGNPMQHFAGPWTTGRVTVSPRPPPFGVPQVAIFSGADTRSAAGQGTIELVSGGVVDRYGGDGTQSIAKGHLDLSVLPEPTAWTGATGGALLLGPARWRRAGRPTRQAE